MKLLLIFTWLRLKRWFRTLLIKIGLKTPIDWNAELMQLLDIANEAITLTSGTPQASTTPPMSRRPRRKSHNE